MKTITPLRVFWTDGYPILEDIKEALEIAYKEGCMIRIEYEMYNYPYSITIHPTATLEEVMDKIPTVYGM